MPLFTAVGAYVAGALGLIGTAAVVVGAIVAVGAAYITSRVINGNPNKKGNASEASQGGRIQVPPATNNKIPVLYGNAYVNGIITDARLYTLDQKKNDLMYYCIVLSETCNDPTAVYTVDDIYWNDLRLTYLTDTYETHIVKSGKKTVDGPGEDFEDNNFIVGSERYVSVRIYAGGSAASNQIFPAQSSLNKTPAYQFWGATPANPNGDGSWTAANQMKGLVYAIVTVRYNGEKGFTGLPNMTFKLNNTVKNPADVWEDYMTGVRYGAGIDPSYIDTTATTAWRNFCAEDISYTNKDGTTNQATERYTVNGLLDTTRSVKENIDIVLQNGGAWMSYDVATGLWSPVIKKAITAGDPTVSGTHFTASRSGTTLTVSTFPEGRIEPGQNLYNSAGTLIGTISAQLAPTTGETAGQKGRYTTSTTGTITTTTFYTTAPNLLTFSDDNIISGISISSTRLDDLYNSVEAEFYDQYNRDQKAYARNEISSGLRNPNEPDNQLRMSLDLCNNSMQADILGQMELRQSRDDLVIEFTSNHYGIQTQAGDIVNVYSELYDWAPKLFRVMRVKEQETEEGGLVAQIQAMEYNGDVYTVEPITEFTTEENIGIGVYGASPNLPLPPDVIIAAVDADVAIPNFQLQVTVPAEGGPFDEIELYYTEGWDEIDVTGSIVPGTGSNGAAVGQGLLTIATATYGIINPGDRIDLGVSGSIYIVSQLTNTPASKTFVSGGTPVSVNPATTTSRLITLNNVTGLLVGNTLTGTGIPNGSFIIEIDAGTNTVRIEDAVTAQAGGTYTVSGGLGTYVVDVSTTVSNVGGTPVKLYDIPEVDNYKFLKKITPEGNNATFTNGQIINDVITNVPANSATYRRWFVKARMGIKKRFGAFSQPGETDFEQGRFPYKPNPTAAGALADLTDVSITSASQGQLLVYNAVTSKWNNEYEVKADTIPETIKFTKNATTADDDFESEVNLIVEKRITDAASNATNDGGPSIQYARSFGATGGTTRFGQVAFDYFGTTLKHKFAVRYSTDDFFESGGLYPNTFNLITSTPDQTNINDGVLYVDAVNNRIGVNNTSPAYTLDVTGDAYINDNLTVHGSTFLGNNYITDVTNVVGEFDVTNNSVSNLFVDHTTGYVGINDNTPSYNLDVNGTANIETSLTVPMISTLTGDDLNISAFSGRDINITATNGGNGGGLTLAVTTSVDPVTIVRNTTNTNTVGRTLTMRHNSSNTPTVGFGNQLEFETETTPGTTVQTGNITNKSTGDNAGVLDEFEMSFSVMSAGTSTERMVLDNLGNLDIDGDITVSGGDITLNGSTSGSVKLSAGAAPAVQTYTLPTAYPGLNNYGLRSTTAGVLSWALTGDVSGPSSSTDNAVARFDLTTGKIIQNSGVIIDDSNNITGVVSITASGDIQGDSLTANSRIDTDGVLELYATGFASGVETQSFYYTASGTGLQTVNSWATISYITGKYTLSMRKGTDYHSMEIMVLHDGTTAYMNTYSEIFTNASLATLTVDISGGLVRLRVTPTTVGSLEMNIERKLFTAI